MKAGGVDKSASALPSLKMKTETRKTDEAASIRRKRRRSEVHVWGGGGWRWRVQWRGEGWRGGGGGIVEGGLWWGYVWYYLIACRFLPLRNQLVTARVVAMLMRLYSVKQKDIRSVLLRL